MDKRTSMGIAGDLNKFTQYSAAEAMTAAAANPSGGMGAGLGMGMGMAMAQMVQPGPWGASAAEQPVQAPTVAPPPLPVEHVWHVADSGKTTGPFSRASMGRMVSDGTLTRETLVWTAGQDGWQKAEDVADLATLFTILPPPLPGN